MRLQGQKDENIDRSDEAGERYSKAWEEGATVRSEEMVMFGGMNGQEATHRGF